MPKARAMMRPCAAVLVKAEVLRIDVELRVAVHVEDALIGAGGHGGQVPGAGTVVGVDAVKAAHGVGKTEIADEALLDAVVLEPEDGGIFGMELDSVEEFESSGSDALIGSAGVAEESLLEEGSSGLGIIAVGGIVGAAEPELALRGDGGNRVAGHASHPGLRELSLPVPVMDALGDADAEKRLQVGIGVVGGRRSEPLPVVVAGALINGEGDGVRGRCSWGGRRSGVGCGDHGLSGSDGSERKKAEKSCVDSEHRFRKDAGLTLQSTTNLRWICGYDQGAMTKRVRSGVRD